MRLKLKRTPGIYLVGFMGSGKTTVGRALADEIGWSFVDLDVEIERRAELTIPEIFDQRGEPAFRDLESALLKQYVRSIECGRPHVLSLGGGAFLSPPNVELVVNNGVSLWLDCPLDTIEQRVAGSNHRPLARDPVKMRELYEARREGYSRADYRVEIRTDDPLVVVKQILELPLF
jgi:shikimate kinase